MNLTIPDAHAEVSLAALAAGKHVYLEKPLSVTRADGARVLEAARSSKRRLGGAPDTFLGGGIQTCRKLIDDGWIGRPIAATAFMTTPRPRALAPGPRVLLQAGRRADARHGPLLPDGARDAARPDRPGHRLGQGHLRREDDHQRAQVRAEDQGRSADPRGRRPGLRLGRDRHDPHDLRRLGRATCPASRSTARPAASRCRTPTPSEARSSSCGRTRRNGARCRWPSATPRTAAASAWRTWPTRSRPAGRTAPPAR